MKERSPGVSRALVGVLVGAAIIAGIVTFVRQRDPGTGQFHPDGSLVTITSDGRFEIVDGADGDLVRLMRDDLSTYAISRVAVTPNGRYAFHDGAQTSCGDDTYRAIERLDLVRGVSLPVAIGTSPALSPDGRQLAFLTEGTKKGPAAFVKGGRPVCEERGSGTDELLAVLDLREEDATYVAGSYDAPLWPAEGKLVSTERRRAGYTIVQFLSSDEALGYRCAKARCDLAVIDPQDGSELRNVATVRDLDVRYAELDRRQQRLLVGSGAELITIDLETDELEHLGPGIVTAAWLPS
jgi:hypothetical protein